VVEKEAIPDKLLKDCLKCPRRNACDEIAMYKGTLPKIVARAPRSPKDYVQIAPLHA
jgi:amino-acid N-acetyltransferase